MRGFLSVSAVTDLAATWEADAEILERHEDARGATLCRRSAAALREAVRADQDRLLTVAEAALESGFSEDHLRHGVADGKIRNAGKKGAPRIRHCDLPIKGTGRRGIEPSPEKAAAAILGHGSGA